MHPIIDASISGTWQRDHASNNRCLDLRYMAEREKLETMLSEMERDFKNRDGPAQWVPKQRSQDDYSAPRLNREGSDKTSVKSGNESMRSLR